MTISNVDLTIWMADLFRTDTQFAVERSLKSLLGEEQPPNSSPAESLAIRWRTKWKFAERTIESAHNKSLLPSETEFCHQFLASKKLEGHAKSSMQNRERRHFIGRLPDCARRAPLGGRAQLESSLCQALASLDLTGRRTSRNLAWFVPFFWIILFYFLNIFAIEHTLAIYSKQKEQNLI